METAAPEASTTNTASTKAEEAVNPYAFFGAETPDNSGAGKTIGCAHFWLGNEYNNGMNAGYCEYLEAKGYKINATNAMNNTSQQVSDIENFISSGVDGIIICGGERDAFVDVANKAKEAGIPVVCCDMVLPASDYSISADNYAGGVMLANYLLSQMNGEGKVAIIGGAGWKSLGSREEAKQP